MNVQILSSDFAVPDAISEDATRRLRILMTRHSDRISRVEMHLGKSCDPSGTAGKFCRVNVHLVDAPVAIVRDIGPDLPDLIGRVTHRAARLVAKRLNSHQEAL